MQSTGIPKAKVIATGLLLGGRLFREKAPLDTYASTLGNPERTIDAGPPAPVGHRNNQVHLFDRFGIYLTEHHSSRLIESVNFIFEAAESPFSIEQGFLGVVQVFGNELRRGSEEGELTGFNRDLPGEYSLKSDGYWIGVSTIGRKTRNGKRTKPRFVVRVSVCF